MTTTQEKITYCNTYRVHGKQSVNTQREVVVPIALSAYHCGENILELLNITRKHKLLWESTSLMILKFSKNFQNVECLI